MQPQTSLRSRSKRVPACQPGPSADRAQGSRQGGHRRRFCSACICLRFSRLAETRLAPLWRGRASLEVDDMQKTADYLRTKGVDIVWGPRVRETYSRAEICDPNGYHIELRQWFR